MPKVGSVVASITQQSRQRVLQSQTEYRERPKAAWVQMVRRAEDQWQSVDDVSVPQSWTWIGFIHGLDWIGLGQKFCPLHCFSEDGSAFV